GEKPKALVKTKLSHRAGKLGKIVAAAYKKKHDVRVVQETFRGLEHGLVFMRAPEVAGIPDHKLVLQAPAAPQTAVGAVSGRYVVVVTPVMNDADAISRNSA